MTKRQKGPRRVVLESLQIMKDNLRYVTGHWYGATKIWDNSKRGVRPALPHELPENRTDRWLELAEYADAVAREAIALRDLARKMARRTWQ